MPLKGTARSIVISFILTLLATSAARAGSIEGTVKDSKTGEALIGAGIKVVGTNLGTSTDLDGKFSIGNVPAGTYSLRVLYTGYTQKMVTGIIVLSDGATPIPITLEPEAQDQGDAIRMEDVYVTAERVTNTNAAILTERLRSAVIGDGISAEQIRLSPDGTSSDALKRVTGLSIVDDKFVFVRGVTDRYNSTTLNGVSVTGTDTDADKKSFSFDLVPAALISNTVVAKTATPDLPGDFSGGLVQVNTLDLPSSFLLSATAEMGHDEVSSRKDIASAPGGDDDWKAKDDGSRALPSGLTGVPLAQALPNTWGTSEDTSHRNATYGLAVGDRYSLGGGDIGFIASGTYKYGYKLEDYRQAPLGGGEGGLYPLFWFDGTRYRARVLMGGLLNLSYQPTPLHRITFENNYSRSAEDKVLQAQGFFESSSDTNRFQVIEWDQRDLYLGQLAGDHQLPFARDLKLDWHVAFSNSKAQEPDRKYADYERGPYGYLLKENYRTWSELEENTHVWSVDAELPVGEGMVKTGFLHTRRERSFDIESWITDPSKLDRQHRTLLLLPIDKIFAGENYGTGMFQFKPYSPFTGAYDGSHELNAYYGMLDMPFRVSGAAFRFAGGVRVEDSNQIVTSPIAADDPTLQTAQIDQTDALPSANLTYQVTPSSNLRLGYFKSVNRPEFRELANVSYLDFDANQTVVGNPNLDRAIIDNYDVRAEWFPRIGEVLAVSYFNKKLTDAIEEELIPAPDRYVRTWFNSPTGKNVGFEIEARKSLGFAWDPLEYLVVQGNYTRVESEVEYTEAHTDPQGNAIYETKTRTLQGQAPYTINAGLSYSVPDIGLSASFLYNRFGRRLAAVGDTRDQDIFEEPRDLFDLAFTEQFTEWARLKFTVRDIVADDVVYTLADTGSPWASTRVGTTYAISLSFNL
jgi:outer membrane receptor protein involved in Fe transport